MVKQDSFTPFYGEWKLRLIKCDLSVVILVNEDARISLSLLIYSPGLSVIWKVATSGRDGNADSGVFRHSKRAGKH